MFMKYLTSLKLAWIRYPDPQCWAESKDIVFLVCYLLYLVYICSSDHSKAEDHLFRVDIGRLKHHSMVIDDIFSIPPSKDSSEGTEVNPIKLEGIKASALASFIKWLNH